MEEDKKENQEESKILEKDLSKTQEKTLRNVLVTLGIFSLVVIAVIFLVNSQHQFKYKGIDFKVHRGNVIRGLTIYSTSIPVIYKGIETDYNFYFRKDARLLESIPFEGTIYTTSNAVINATQDFNCNGDGIIAIANLVKMYELLGTKVIKDPNATCDQQGRYMFIQIEEGPETRIDQTGPACYTLKVKDCEILEVTEKLMAETFVKLNQEPPQESN